MSNVEDIEALSFDDSDDADLICLFGLSFGETDARWWDKVEKVLLARTKVVLFEYNPKLPKFSKNQGPKKWKVLSLLKLNEYENRVLRKNIFIAYNSDMFKLKLTEDSVL